MKYALLQREKATSSPWALPLFYHFSWLWPWLSSWYYVFFVLKKLQKVIGCLVTQFQSSNISRRWNITCPPLKKIITYSPRSSFEPKLEVRADHTLPHRELTANPFANDRWKVQSAFYNCLLNTIFRSVVTGCQMMFFLVTHRPKKQMPLKVLKITFIVSDELFELIFQSYQFFVSNRTFICFRHHNSNGSKNKCSHV